jgi:predicted membrane channel-forming protein YqfA (hemolysin III family)
MMTGTFALGFNSGIIFFSALLVLGNTEDNTAFWIYVVSVFKMGLCCTISNDL